LSKMSSLLRFGSRTMPSAASRRTLRSRMSTSSSSSSAVRLPIVDLSLVTNERVIGQSLHEACTTFGFFYLVGHGIPATLRQSVLEQGRTFFEAETADKESISAENSHSFRGYQRLKVNQTNGQQDLHEGLDIFSESTRGQVEGVPSNHGRNQWPDETQFPNFQSTVEDYASRMQHVGDRLMRACALGLELGDANYFAPYFEDPFWNMRLVYYPQRQGPTLPQDKEALDGGGLGVGEHTDYGIFTMILAEEEHSHNTLQVRLPHSSEWVYVQPLPGAMICNVADMLATWTNGIYKSTPHRVLPPLHTKGRVSVPFFYDPSYDAVVRPIPELVQRSPQQSASSSSSSNFAPICYGDHLYAKTSRNFVF